MSAVVIKFEQGRDRIVALETHALRRNRGNLLPWPPKYYAEGLRIVLICETGRRKLQPLERIPQSALTAKA